MQRDPGVGTFTTLIGCLAVNEMLDRIFGYSEGVADLWRDRADPSPRRQTPELQLDAAAGGSLV